MKDDHFFPERLLSKRNRFTVQEKESVLKAVLEHTEETREKSFRERMVSPSRIVVTTLGILLLAVPLVFLVLPSKKETFTPRGGKGASAVFSVRCIAKEKPGSCKKGSRIVFKIIPPIDKGYLSVFAKHRSSGTVIWYFPDSEGEVSLEVGKYLKEQTFIKAIGIGDEHAFGTYDVYGVFTDRALKRSEIRRLMNERAKKRRLNGRVEIVKRILKVK